MPGETVSRAERTFRPILGVLDARFPVPATAKVLEDPRNAPLLDYLAEDAFTHVFPGDRAGTVDQLCASLDAELAGAPSYHLWLNVPLCRYRCAFCQFPIQVLRSSGGADEARHWVDLMLDEMALWVERVPRLAETPIGELCLFGGTPTALPAAELERLVTAVERTFTFTEASSWRAEGSPDTLNRPMLDLLRRLGFGVLVFGIQSFDDAALRLAGRGHTAAQALGVIEQAREAGFGRVDGDLIYGLPGQRVDDFVRDVHLAIDAGLDTVATMKLHLRSFVEAGTAVGHQRPAAWQDQRRRDRIAASGRPWPSLGEQLQMREQAEHVLHQAGYREHPTTYFVHERCGPARWRRLNLDQDQQVPQLGIGLGGYVWTSRAQAVTTTDPGSYDRAVGGGCLPIDEVTTTTDRGREVRSVAMALTTCQPLDDGEHGRRFEGTSLLDPPWSGTFDALADRGLVTIDRRARTVALTAAGRTLVEAIVNTALP